MYTLWIFADDLHKKEGKAMTELVSVIVPVYNVEPYIRECLDSIIASTYRNLEIIVVDDGSPDNCPAICDEYARKDPRIKVIHQKNQGLVSARNAGLAVASGKYVGFVDSDDAVSPVMYEMMVAAMEQTGAEMAACESRSDMKDLITSPSSINRAAVCLDTFDMRLAMLTNAPSVRSITWSYCFVYNKLYLRERILDGFRAQYLVGEDLEFNYRYIENSQKTVIVPACLYMYRQNPSSVTHLYFNSHKTLQIDEKTVAIGISNVDAWLVLTRSQKITDEALRKYIGGRAAYVAHNVLWRICANKLEHDYSDFCKESRGLIKEYCIDVARNKVDYTFKFRAICLLCGKFFPIWKLLTRIYGKFGNKKH